MKLLKDYKKQFNRVRALGSSESLKLSLVILLVMYLFFSFHFSSAQTAEEIQNRINAKSAEIEKLEKDIKAFQGELGELGAQKVSLNNSLQQLDVTRKKLNADISLTQNKIDKTNLEIQSLSSDILDKEDTISNDVSAISLDLRSLDEFDRSGMTEVLLSENDFTSIWNDIDNMATLRERILEKINTLKKIKGELEDTRGETISAKEELVELRTDLADQKKIVDQNTVQKNKLLKDTKNSEANYQKLVADQTAKKLSLEQEIRDYESRLEFLLDRSKLPKSGVLAWPLDYIYVTQHFGEKDGPHRIYANGHSGTDFRARTPLKTYAMADGVVMGTGNTDLTCPGASFGQWILIKYDNGLASTHAHLSLIKVSKGQRVSRGETIGYTGGTGRVTAPHLHISLYVAEAVKVETLPSKSCPGKILTQPIAATTAYLDSMYYLPPYIAPE